MTFGANFGSDHAMYFSYGYALTGMHRKAIFCLFKLVEEVTRAVLEPSACQDMLSVALIFEVSSFFGRHRCIVQQATSSKTYRLKDR